MANTKKAVNKTIVLAWLTISREKIVVFCKLWGGLTYFDIKITLSNQQKRYEMKNVKKTETHFDWSTLFLCQSRSILPKPIKGTSMRYSVLFMMKAFKFLRGLFEKKEKKDKREEEMRKERMRTEREKQLFNLIEEMEEGFRWLEERNRRKAIDRRRKKMEIALDEERKKRKFRALCQFFERRGYEFYTRTPMVKMGDLYPDLKEFMSPTENRA